MHGHSIHEVREQVGPDSTSADIAALDFNRVNPVSGPCS
jgi:hypothetical protein